MTFIESVTLEVPDTAAADAFYTAAFGLDDRLALRASDAPTTGFRAFTLSLVVSQPATVDGLIGAAVDAGATALKPAKKSFWGYGGVIQAPDGTIWKVATSSKKYSGPATRDIDEFVLLLGVEDVVASKWFYADRGLEVAKSFGRKYVQFDTHTSSWRSTVAARWPRTPAPPPTAAARTGLVVGSDAGSFTDPTASRGNRRASRPTASAIAQQT